MPEELKPIEIVVCMGSSCFVRGNADNLAVLKEFVATEDGQALQLTGSLCQDFCRQSPNLCIDGRYLHGVTPAELREKLKHIHEPWNECWQLPAASEARGKHGAA